MLLLYVIYEWGRFAGGYSKFAEVQRRRELAAQIETLEQENEKLRADIAKAELARNVDNKSYGVVEKNLEDLQAQVLKQREELTFYRGIVSPGGRHRRTACPGLPDPVRRRAAALPPAARAAAVDA